MHIGIDCRLPTYQMGGISQYTIYLIQALGRLPGNNRYTIFHSGRETRSFLPPGRSDFSRSDLFTPCHHRVERYALGIELARYGLDVFHSPDFIPPITGAKRKIITVHDLNFIYYPEFLTPESRRYYSGQIEWAVTMADHVIADSEATRLDLINLLAVAPRKVKTIHLAANPVYSAVCPPEIVAATVSEYGVGHGFILAVGTLEPRKNLPVLLQAYRTLRRDFGISVPLVLVGGKGWRHEEIFLMISNLDLDKHVIHLSAVPDTHLVHLYRAAGVLAFPSHYEGFGLPALEAMLGGCPVVASNRGSLPEVVGDAAPTLDPDDVESWVKALHLVLSDREYAHQLRSMGFAQASLFTWDKTAAATLAVYEGRDLTGWPTS